MRRVAVVVMAVLVAVGLFGAGFLVGGSTHAPPTPQGSHSGFAVRQVKVPDVSAMPLHKAFLALVGSGLGVGKLTAEASDLERGAVVRQTVNPGKSVPLGTHIPLTVSAGPHPNVSSDGKNAFVGGSCDLALPTPPSQPPCIGGILVPPFTPQ